MLPLLSSWKTFVTSQHSLKGLFRCYWHLAPKMRDHTLLNPSFLQPTERLKRNTLWLSSCQNDLEICVTLMLYGMGSFKRRGDCPQCLHPILMQLWLEQPCLLPQKNATSEVCVTLVLSMQCVALRYISKASSWQTESPSSLTERSLERPENEFISLSPKEVCGTFWQCGLHKVKTHSKLYPPHTWH